MFYRMLAGCLLILLAMPIHAAVYTVTNTQSSGSGSLYQAVENANDNPGADTIRFSPSLGRPIYIAVPETLWLKDAYTTIEGDVNGDNVPDVVLTNAGATAGIKLGTGIQQNVGHFTVYGLVVSGFSPGQGILIYHSDHNDIAYCYLGTNASGSGAAANGSGLAIRHSKYTTIRNCVISGNTSCAIGIIDSECGSLPYYSTHNSITGCIIGLNAAGTAAVPNRVGIDLCDGSSDNTIGGVTAAKRNIISGNQGAAVLIEAGLYNLVTENNLITGNYIGLNKNGSAVIPNENSGIAFIQVSNNRIVGNVISGNRDYGILLSGNGSDGNEIADNIIGLTATGQSAAGNQKAGIMVSGDSPYTTITNNVISSNGIATSPGDADNPGIFLLADNCTLQGNIIGLDPTGSIAFGNGSQGISMSGAQNCLIGGDTVDKGNIISSHPENGIVLLANGNPCAYNTILGNLIGTDITAGQNRGNGSMGVNVRENAHHNTISNNVIGCSGHHGVVIHGSDTHSNSLKGNYIGCGWDGATPLGNSLEGIYVAEGAHDNFIGDSMDHTAGNTISFNGRDGIAVGTRTTASPARISIRKNVIAYNAGQGIDLDSDGVTPNGSGYGANNNMDFPVITGYSNHQLQGTAPAGALIDIFMADGTSADHGEATLFLASGQAGGSGNFSILLPEQDAESKDSYVVTATATDAGGNTSEFCQNYRVQTIPGLSPVFRFFNTRTGCHLYTNSQFERDNILDNLPHYTYEGVKFYVYSGQETGSTPVFRFLNTRTGVHLYTVSEVERDYILDNLPHYSYEGVKFYVYAGQEPGTTPMYRFFNTQNGGHLYTISRVERDYIIQNFPHYNYEGIKFYVFP